MGICHKAENSDYDVQDHNRDCEHDVAAAAATPTTPAPAPAPAPAADGGAGAGAAKLLLLLLRLLRRRRRRLRTVRHWRECAKGLLIGYLQYSLFQGQVRISTQLNFRTTSFSYCLGMDALVSGLNRKSTLLWSEHACLSNGGCLGMNVIVVWTLT